MGENHSVEKGRELRAMFPEQTRSIPAILLWLLVFLADVALVLWIAGKLGIGILEMGFRMRGVMVMVSACAAFGLFWLEATVYNKIVSLFR